MMLIILKLYPIDTVQILKHDSTLIAFRVMIAFNVIESFGKTIHGNRPYCINHIAYKL